MRETSNAMCKTKTRHPEHLLNALISFIGLTTMTVMAGELMADIIEDEENFPQIPDMAKPLAVVVFLGFAALEANKVRARLTRARGFK